MARQFFSGNSIEQALLAAAKHYGLEPNQIAYKHRDKKHGFLNMRRRVVIEVDPSAPELSQPALSAGGTQGASPEPAEAFVASPEPTEASAASPVARRVRSSQETWEGQDEFYDEDLSESAALEGSLDEIVALLGLSLDHSLEISDEGVEIDLEGEGSGVLADDTGKCLQAIEHLVPRMVRGFIGYGLPCRVDSGGFKAAREAELRELAESVAEQVRRSTSDQLLEPMSPADRRLVHMALAEDPTVRTESEGEGFLKRVRVLSAD